MNLRANIDGGEPVACTDLTIEHEQIDITTRFEPDPAWQYVDPSGHYHAWSTADPKLPTLRTHQEHVGCDDPEHEDCEGYTRTTYACVACDAPVEPRHRPTSGRRYMRGMQSWSAEVEAHIPGNARVSVVVVTPHGRRFGFAIPVGVSAEGDADGIRIRTRLVGAGPLGERS